MKNRIFIKEAYMYDSTSDRNLPLSSEAIDNLNRTLIIQCKVEMKFSVAPTLKDDDE